MDYSFVLTSIYISKLFINKFKVLRSKTTFSLLSFLRKRQFERGAKNGERKVQRIKRNDNLLSKIVVSFWRAWGDSNPRPTGS